MTSTEKLFEFIKSSPTAYQAVDTVVTKFSERGFKELSEADEWELEEGQGYYVKRNGTSLIAFVMRPSADGFMICASHSDSPSFRLKLSLDLKSEYVRLDTEKYGGMLYYSWLDRPLSLAGRVVVKEDGGCGVYTKTFDLKKDIAVIPSVAIHMNRDANNSLSLNPKTDMLPLFSGKNGSIIDLIASAASVDKDSIISHDIFLYNREEGRTIGGDGEFILCPRLDDLECVFASTEAFLSCRESGSVPVLAVFDNEEVGSATKQGADSTFLYDVLSRIAGVRYRRMIASSFMVSADNAHANHPNHPELSDRANAPVLNGGVVVKFNANQKYATDGISDAIFRTICKRANVKTQTYYNRADIPGGSTLGSISNTNVSVPTVDIGLAQLAMHSATETAGAVDLQSLIDALREFYSTSLKKDGEIYKF